MINNKNENYISSEESALSLNESLFRPANDEISSIRCDECPYIPFIGLSYKNKEEINIDCICPRFHKKTINIRKFFSKENVRSSFFSKIICRTCRDYQIDEKYYFCNKCNCCFCNKCSFFHKEQKGHILILISKFDSTCVEHNDKIISYCLSCLKDICMICYDNHEHHQIINLVDCKLKQNEMETIEEKIQYSKTFLENLKELFHQVINEMDSQASLLKNSYQQFNEINLLELKLAEELIYIYKKTEKERNLNYAIIENVKSIINFNFVPFSYQNYKDNILVKAKEIEDYVKNIENSILKESKINYEKIHIKRNLYRPIYNDNPFLEKIQIFNIKGHKDTVYHLLILNDGRLASCGGDNLIILYRINDYSVQLIINEHTNQVLYITQLQEGQILSCSRDFLIKKIRLTSPVTYIIEEILKEHTGAVKKIIQLFNSKIVSCSEDYTIKFWEPNNNIENKILICTQTINCEKNSIDNILQINNEELVSSFSTFNNEHIKFFNILTYETISTIKIECSSSNNCLCMVNSHLLGIGGKSGIFFVDIIKHNYSFKINSENDWIDSIVMLRDGNILTGECIEKELLSYEGIVGEYKMDGDECIIVSKKKIHDGEIYSMVQSRDGTIFTSSSDELIKGWK